MNNDAINCYNEGYNYYTGTNGFPLNYNKALECFQKAAELGNSSAMSYLGFMYQYGQNVIQDSRVAADWYYKAIQADNRNAYAAHSLGCLYYDGDGVPKDLNKAFQFFKVSVELGLGNTTSVYPKSCYMAGMIAMEHYKNSREAVPFFIDAATCGDIPEAWHNLGWLCEQGMMDISKSDILATALEFYKNAAELGLAQSMDAVGRIYASVQMLDEARVWIQKAANKGYEPAKKRLKMLNVAQGGSLWNLFK